MWSKKTSICVKELSRKAEEKYCKASIEKGCVSSEVEELIGFLFVCFLKIKDLGGGGAHL